MTEERYDAVVVGAGFSGLYMLHRLRGRGLRVLGVERGGDVGGTWYWNRYPGCRCDVESMEYSYQFSPDLEQDWSWTERYASQPEILAYARHVAERFDLKRSYRFETRLAAARFDDADGTWQVSLVPEGPAGADGTVTARYLIMATGCLSAANVPDFPGLDAYRGRTFHTGRWPHEGVDFSGERVGVIGTGSSGIQSIPLIARQAAELTVFQRTPNYSVPARNRPLDPSRQRDVKARYRDLRARNQEQPAAFGSDYPRRQDSALAATPEERERRFEEYWQHGGFMFLGAFGDLVTDLEANELAAEFVRGKIRSIVEDPETAELLCPRTVLGCKRLCADTGYFETYNRPNVHLVDVSEHPIERFTPAGLVTGGREYVLDSMVFATGFDAMTGALLRCDITGRGGVTLRDKWSAGPRTFYGLMVEGFPNLFTMTGPGSPSVLANMITAGEQHAEFIDRLVGHAGPDAVIEPERAAEDDWVAVVNARAEDTLYPRCNSWYLGANVPGKPRVFMPFIGFPAYRERLEEMQAAGYRGLRIA
ncbi:MAG: cyclohexanone monooxygenase [Gammaproteobacteria bacterium]|nr:cyclohexanone monooxygenase [Gammaproteobacteria bacterium]|tara:strand:+ start:4015 stop:5622 length:1608 start_codon:yes stop_codon:yes gene_type:complete